MIDVWSGWDAGCCIAEVSPCADFSLLRCLSSAIMSLWCFWPGQRPARMLICKKAWTSVSVAVLQPGASRIALSKSDGNEQKPRLYMQRRHPQAFLAKRRAGWRGITYPRASTVARPLTLI